MATVRNGTGGLEQRLFSYLDRNLQEIKDALRNQNEKMENLLVTSATKHELGATQSDVEKLKQDVLLITSRTTTLETAREEAKKRPMEAWQVVTGIFFIIMTLCSFGLSAMSLLVTLLQHFTFK